MAVLKDLIVHGNSRFLNGARFNTINAESIGASEGIFNKLVATTLEAKEASIEDLTAQNATVVGLLDVQGQMQTSSWTNANMATIDGSFYICPTISSEATVTNSGTTQTSNNKFLYNGSTITLTGTWATTNSIYVNETAANWTLYSKVMVTGEVLVNNEWNPIGTIRGVITGINTTNGTITIGSLSTNTTVKEGIINSAPAILSIISINSVYNARKLKISLYEYNSSGTSSGSTNLIGIMMTTAGTHGFTYLDIYNGANSKTSYTSTIDNTTTATEPVLRIGNLNGLPNTVSGSTAAATQPKGWGIYTTNGYFKGTVVASSGTIGNGNAAWTIGNDSNTGAAYIYTGILGVSPSAYISTGYGITSIANSGTLTNDKKWVFTAGDKFGVTNEGDLYASNANIEGAITATSLTIGNGNNTFNGIDAINITGYSIEIEEADIANVVDYKKLIPHLYHNGVNADSEVADWTNFIWYKDDESTGILGDEVDGSIIGYYGSIYKVTYRFEDGAVEGGSEITTITVQPTDYITDINNSGIKIHPKNHTTGNYIQLDGTGMEVFEIGQTDVSVAFFGANGAQIGKTAGAHTTIDEDGMQIFTSASVELANIGYGEGTAQSGTATAPYYSFGIRQSGSTIGNYSLAEGTNTTASGYSSHAEGRNTTASGAYSHAEGQNATASNSSAHAEGVYTTASGDMSHAEGYSTDATASYSHAEGNVTVASGNGSHAEGTNTTASGYFSHAEGWGATASGDSSHAQNRGTIASQENQTAIGQWNKEDTATAVADQKAFIIGNGTANNARSDALTVDWSGNVVIAGTLTQSSDRRLKTHQSYLSTDAINFIQNLKPAYFKKDDQFHVGFYAQDVEKIDSWNCMVGEMNGYKTLGYTEIIAPLVTYCQYLEERIKQLEL